MSEMRVGDTVRINCGQWKGRTAAIYAIDGMKVDVRFWDTENEEELSVRFYFPDNLERIGVER